MKKFVLWDLDGTLLDTGGISGKAMRAAMERVFGPVPQKDRRFFSGKTDWQIIHDSFPDMDRAVIAERLPAFKQAYLDELQQRRTEMLACSKVLPGVMKVLKRLKDEAVMAPLTGNVTPVAHMKLDMLGLLVHLNPDIGAYGDDSCERRELVPIAIERANRQYDHQFTGQQVVIVGDTPNDVACGRASGARTVIVATGPYGVDELQPHEPDALFPNLRDLEAVVAAILDT
jgi:phosphoglycolate phosphatase